MDFDSVPPDRGPCIGYLFISIPLGILKNEMKGMPLSIGSPGVIVGYPVHTESGDPMGSNLPVIWVCNIFSLGRFDLNLITVLHVDPAICITIWFSVAAGTHHDKFNMAFITGIFLLSHQVMGS